jgi:predicted RNase H-like nuclease (RuvC/YqgF family)
MNTKIGITILAVACFGFAVALVVIKHQADAQQAASASTILDFSNQIVKATVSIEDLNQANQTLSSDLATNREMSLELSNHLAQAVSTLATTTTSLETAQQQITNLNGRVMDLESQNQALDQRATTLSNTIASMDTQIAETQRKLATSETNNAFLDNELKLQIAQRAELQRKFDDLAQVRAQVRKLRNDMLIAQRLEWMREGIDPTKPMKGGQLLMQRPPSTTTASPATTAPLNSLNVEVGSDGSIHVIPPPTNAPAH